MPIKEVLKFAKRSYKLPKWVEINPDDQTVLLRLDQFRMQNGLFVRAEKINLVDDDIRMNIYLPKEKKKLLRKVKNVCIVAVLQTIVTISNSSTILPLKNTSDFYKRRFALWIVPST